MWELEHLPAAHSPRNIKLRNACWAGARGNSPVRLSPGAASATDFAPSKILTPRTSVLCRELAPGLAATRAQGESTNSGAVISDPIETESPRLHILTLEIWSKLGAIQTDVALSSFL